uniref:NADH-plastoquinone oxidoreductase subunit K n=1 Tax=Gongylonema pulchrum TaxID=637853 RepID=A0A183EE23_9BILA
LVLFYGYNSRESYLGRWSRETTPIDSQERYERNIRRSYTPVREIAGYKVIQDDRLPLNPYRARTPLGFITTPYHTNINYYQEQLPIRKYDVFSVRTWAYPIYKFVFMIIFSTSTENYYCETGLNMFGV